MTRARFVLSLGLAAVLAGLAQSSFSQAEKLQHDPFARPGLSGLQHARQAEPRGNGKATAAGPRPKLKLLAVMVAGPNSMANVDGVMVRIGDEVNGYRLVDVSERNAVFEKNKTRFSVSLRSSGQTLQHAGDRQ
jgi:hypothetical protein